MITLEFNEHGNLLQGVHEMEWSQFEDFFGFNHRRKSMMIGLKRALNILKKAGCKKVYIDGSFVTEKKNPRDFDACWDETDVDLQVLKKIEPLFFIFENNRKGQKNKFNGEFFPANMVELQVKKIFLEFFQIDKNTGEPKGIILVDLDRLSP